MMEYKTKVLNKHFILVSGHGTPSIEPNIDFYELTKQWCILDASRQKIELPYISYRPPYYAPNSLHQWRDALTYQNPPSGVNFRSNPEKFREIVEALDFKKPYDALTVRKIHEAFIVGGAKKAVDSSEIVEAELFPDDDK